METIGERLVFLMKENRLTQRVLADRIGVSQQAISDVKNGVVDRPKFIIELARELKTTPEWLQDGAGQQNKSSELGTDPLFVNAVVKAAIRDDERPADKIISMAKEDVRWMISKRRKAGEEIDLDMLVDIAKMAIERGLR